MDSLVLTRYWSYAHFVSDLHRLDSQELRRNFRVIGLKTNNAHRVLIFHDVCIVTITL